jgi:hypothetical protein
LAKVKRGGSVKQRRGTRVVVKGKTVKPQAAKQPSRRSVTLSSELHQEISAKAKQVGISLDRMMALLLRSGLEAEAQKKQQLKQRLEHFRSSADPAEAERLGYELGEMIFGR